MLLWRRPRGVSGLRIVRCRLQGSGTLDALISAAQGDGGDSIGIETLDFEGTMVDAAAIARLVHACNGVKVLQLTDVSGDLSDALLALSGGTTSLEVSLSLSQICL